MTKKSLPACTVPMPENPHALVRGLIARSEASKAEARRKGWTIPEIYSDTDVGRQILRLHDAVLKAGETRGYSAEISKSRDTNTFCLLIRGERVAWRIREAFSRKKVPLTAAEMKDRFNIAIGKTEKTVDQPLGRLILIMTSHYSVDKRIEENPKRLLIDRVPEILNRFEAAVAHAEARAAEWEESKREGDRQRAIQAAREKLKAAEKRRWGLLRKVAGERDEIAALRDTAELVRKRLEGTPFENHPRTIAWTKWADERIRRLDVLSRSPQAIFQQLVART